MRLPNMAQDGTRTLVQNLQRQHFNQNGAAGQWAPAPRIRARLSPKKNIDKANRMLTMSSYNVSNIGSSQSTNNDTNHIFALGLRQANMPRPSTKERRPLLPIHQAECLRTFGAVFHIFQQSTTTTTKKQVDCIMYSQKNIRLIWLTNCIIQVANIVNCKWPWTCDVPSCSSGLHAGLSSTALEKANDFDTLADCVVQPWHSRSEACKQPNTRLATAENTKELPNTCSQVAHLYSPLHTLLLNPVQLKQPQNQSSSKLTFVRKGQVPCSAATCTACSRVSLRSTFD